MSRFPGARLVPEYPASRFPGARLVGHTPSPKPEEPIQSGPLPTETKEPTVEWSGQEVPVSKVREVADDRGVSPESIMRLGTWQGRLEARLSKSLVGQGLLRAESGISQAAGTGLSLLSRAGILGDHVSDNVHREQALRNEYLALIEKGGDVEDLLGERGNRIFNSVTESIAKIGAVGPLGGTAVLSSIGAENYDQGLQTAEQLGLTGADKIGYAGRSAAIETGVTFLMGRFAKSLGLNTLEEMLSPGMRDAAKNVVEKTGVAKRLSQFVKGLGGAGLEATEESIVDVLQQINETAETGKGLDWARTIDAGIAGAVGAGAVNAAQSINASLGKKLSGPAIEETVKGVKAAEVAIGAEAGPNLSDQLVSRFAKNTTPENLERVRTEDLTAKEFAELTGIRKSSKTFRDSFKNTLEVYARPVEGPVTENRGPQTPPESPLLPETATETPIAPGPPVAAEGPTTPTPTTGGPTSTKQASIDQDREIMELLEVPAFQSLAFSQALQTARDNGVPARSLDIANDTKLNPRVLTPVETAGMTVRMAELKLLQSEARKQMSKLDDPADIRVQGERIAHIRSEYAAVSESLHLSGSLRGQALSFQRLTVDDSYDLLPVLADAKGAKGELLTETDTAGFETLTDKEATTNRRLKTIDGKKRDLDKDIAHREVQRLKSAVGSIRRILGLDLTPESSYAVPGLSDKNRAQLTNLSAKLAEADESLNTAEIVEPSGRVNNRPSEKQVSALDDAVAKTRAELKRRLKRPLDGSREEQRKIATLEKKLAEAQDILSRARQGEPIDQRRQKRADVMSEQRDKLFYELSKARQEIRDRINDMRPKTLFHKFGAAVDFSRALITGNEFSAVLRQGKYTILSHPLIGAGAIRPMLQATRSDRAAFELEQEILSRPNAPLYAQKLRLHKRDDVVSDKVEFFTSRVLGKEYWSVLGLNVFNPVAASQRAYVAFINQIRADSFDAIVASRGPGLTMKDYADIGHLINVFTGQGEAAIVERHMFTASRGLFSPRYSLSRFQMLVGEPAWRTSTEVRKIAAQEYARAMLGASLMYGLAAAAWGDDPRFSITFDPRSTDFGKIVFGDTRLDPLAGLAQVARFTARILTSKSVRNGRVDVMSPYDKRQEVVRFVQSKLAPGVGTGLDLMTGADVMGHPTNLSSMEGARNVATNLTVPLSYRDIAPAMEDQGVGRGTVLGILSLLGEGLQVYEPRAKR